ncbi:FMN-dependent NADH-azoreductase [Arachidicoccus ginsenosidimutans]|uniref:FMN-dependent NADH-azoreductase n=1 Tax=Arachidicoccus sp. BS20 TaxID=1850526 RepID=UPI0007F0D247|nr:FMN-dependent NADH-azoreductase [Arachidicoccus sp. BS20]ANI90498.1 FMN-dependent NADH-azoreductase [Arachidicoccus sp. BS20]
MSKILHLISSPRGNESVSIKLGNAIVEKVKAANPGSTVKEVDLSKINLPHLGEEHLISFFTPEEKRTPEHLEAIKYSEEFIKDLFDADVVVFGVPMYNFSIPSSLKSWIDHVARAGVTFQYTANGPEGLVKGKKAYLAVATGGVYSDGPYKPYDFAVPYLQGVLGFIGITDVTVYRAEGLSVSELAPTALQKAVDTIAI